jgi:mono/diheme cytochrome c family protein
MGDRAARLGIAILFLAVGGALTVILLKMGPVDLFGSSNTGQERIAAGRALYERNCASCHGKNLEGQPDWQTPLPSGKLPAPPHDKSGHSWHHPDAILVGITKRGMVPYATPGYRSDMPAFEGILSDDEIDKLWEYIKSTWPERERTYQEQMTRQSLQQGTPQ